MDKMLKLEQWKAKYEKAKGEWAKTREELEQYNALYNGTYEIESNDETKRVKSKKAKSVRNIVAENVDSIVDSNIPTPKVTPTREIDEAKANIIENLLRNELDRMHFETMNDEDERNSSIFGGDLFLVEWDNNGGTHTTIGEMKVTLIDPMHFIPQEKATSIQKCDYIFFEIQITKEQVKELYNVDVEDETTENESQLIMVVGYYKNREKDCIGRISWVNDTLVEDIEDYFARILTRCKKCGQVVYGDKCQYCGSTSVEKKREEYEELYQPIMSGDQVRIPDIRVSYGIDEFGNETKQESALKIPYYHLNQFPVALRKNISINNKLIGESDVKRIKDQQNAIKKHETKMMEKLENAGSFVTLPKGLKIQRKNEEMLVCEVEKPEQINMITTKNMQADTSLDMEYIEYNYQSSRQALGITDSFQGRKDATATSGKAKEFAAAQTAGRLESKKVMKNACYAELFELMFKFMLAFADEPRNIIAKDRDGQVEYLYFNRYDFLEIDEAGEPYWNDEFLFSVDSAAALANNREAMWQETRMNLETGAMGDPQDIQTLIRFWTIMESLHYPKATQIKGQLQEQLEQEQQMQQLMQQNQQLQGQLQQLNGIAQQQAQQLDSANAEINNMAAAVEQANSPEAEFTRQKQQLELESERLKQEQMRKQLAEQDYASELRGLGL